jgi:protein SCO1/2
MCRDKSPLAWVLFYVLTVVSGVSLSADRERALAPAGLSIPDVPVLDQGGQSLRFYRDLVKDKVVAINFIYTTCTTLCPLTGVVFSQAQNGLKGRLGKDVQLISISLDPRNDTPEQLAGWGKKFHAQPGWTLVTGATSAIEQLLDAFDIPADAKEEHPPLLLVGNAAANRWIWINSLATPEQLISTIESMRGPGEGYGT